jgi:protoheme IX farnesyltransferase
MKVAVSVCAEAVPLTRPRALDYLELTKPRIAVLVLATVIAGFLLASRHGVDAWRLLHVVVGTSLVAGGASALNQWLERQRDARMPRTANRPLPSGRLLPAEALAFGVILGVSGTGYLLLALPNPLAAGIATMTFVCYVGVYTPLKSVTTWNTLIGAIPGALPPVIGYTAVTGNLDAGALTLFLIVFVWQIPHFFAIAWMYRHQYARAGMRMLPVVDTGGRRTAVQMLLFCLALLPIGLLPVYLHEAGWFYGVASLLLGLAFLVAAWRFGRQRDDARARRVLRASLLYLPGVLLLLLLDAACR